MLKELTIIVLALALPLASGLPIAEEDQPTFALPPPAPEIAGPDPALVEELTVLVLSVTGMVPEKSIAVLLEDATLTMQTDDVGNLVTSLQGLQGSTTTTLPQLPGSEDFTVYLSQVTMAIDRPGDNPAAGELDATNIADVTLPVWGIMGGFGDIAADGNVTNPSQASVPDGVTLEAEKIVLGQVLDVVTDLVVIDPDDNLLLGTLAEHTNATPATSEAYATAQAMSTALDDFSLESLTLNGVLQGLGQTLESDLLGIVSLQELSATLEDKGISLEIVTLATPDPRTILDLENNKLILVDGGLGKMALLADEKKLVFTDDLVTSLKDGDLEAPAKFVTTSKVGNLTGSHLGITTVDHRLGGYTSLLSQSKALTKNGLSVHALPIASDCKAALDTKVDWCIKPGGPTITPLGGDVAGKLKRGSAALDKLNLKSLPGKDHRILGTGTGELTDLPVSGIDRGTLGRVAMLSPSAGIPGLDTDRKLSTYSIDNWKLPESGVGGVPGIESPNLDAAPDLQCASKCVPSHDLTVLDGMFEHLDAPAVPGVMNIVPVGQLGGLAGIATDLSGTALGLMPLDALKNLPAGQTGTYTARFIGGPNSVQRAVGLDEVSVSFTTKDPLGLNSKTQVMTTNTNGWVSATVPAAGSWSFVATKEDYETVQAAGSAPGPGEESAQQHEMQAATGSKVLDNLFNQGSVWILLLGVSLGAVWMLRRRQGHRSGAAPKGSTKQRRR